MKVKSYFIHSFLTVLSCVAMLSNGYAQTQGRLSAAKLGFQGYACPRATFNSFTLSISWTPPFANADNKFIVELSDSNGEFGANPTVLQTVSNKNFSSTVPVSFSFPKNTKCKNNKIRLRSTSPAQEKIATWEIDNGGGNKQTGEEIEVYYQAISSRITVAPTNVTLCPGHTQEVKVVPSTNNPKPDNYKYKWFKQKPAGSTGSDELLAEDAAPTFTVGEGGVYYAVVDYGTKCSGSTNARSANITVVMSGNQTVTLNSSATAVCTNENITLTATPPISGSKYYWYRGTTKLGETDVNTYTVLTPDNLAGEYYVQVGSGGNCDVKSNKVKITRSDNITASISTTGGNVLMPGKTRVFTASTTAQAPTYKWFKDGNEISGETGATYTANAAGKYKVEVTQGGSCAATVTSPEHELTQPDNFKVSIKTKSAYEDCVYDRITLTVDKITAQVGSNELIVDPSDYSFFTFQWQANTTGTYANVGTNAQEITLDKALDNGKYQLNTTAPNYGAIPTSNEISVLLKDTNALRINGGTAELEYCEGSVTLTITTGANASSTYTWYKDNVQIAKGVGLTSYNTDTSGVFHVSVDANNGGCPATSSSIVVKKNTVVARWVEDIKSKEIFFVGKTNVLQVSTNIVTPTFEWTKNGIVLTGETDRSLNITTAPTSVDIYQAKVTDMGTCGKTITLPPVYFETIADIQSLKVGTLAVSAADCETRSATTLELQRIVVKLSSTGEEVEVKKADFRYFSLQWTKDGNDLIGETDSKLVVSREGNSDSAKYAVRVIYNTTIIKVSDPKVIAFTPIPDFEISTSEGTKGTAFLCTGGTITLTVAADSFDPTSSVSDSFSYRWYKVTSANYHNDTFLNSELPTVVINEIGEYYLEINNGGCPKRAHIKIENYRTGQLKIVQITTAGTKGREITQHSSARERKIDVNVGQQLVAEGGNNFVWVKPDGTSFYGNTLNITSKDMMGAYTLKEESCASAGTNELPFELNVFEVKAIPNIVTPNGDGINDTWLIPDEYCKAGVRVTIYSQEGKEIFSTTNYQNNWPDVNAYKELGKRSLFFIYVIEGDGVEKQKGVVTLLK